jgi:hypothetical protein
VNEQLGARLFRPTRAVLPERIKHACAATSAEAAWRLLDQHGFLPPGWVDHAQRRFAWLPALAAAERRQRLRSAPYVPHAPHPDSGSACAEVAELAAAMTAAEAHAADLIAAAAQWRGVPSPSTILWVPTSAAQYSYQIHDTKPGVWEPDSLVWRLFPSTITSGRWVQIAASLQPSPGDADHASACRAVAPWLLGEEEWIARAQRGDRVDGPASEALAGRSYGELASPFAAALRLFALGFGPLPSSDTSLVLGYPMD